MSWWVWLIIITIIILIIDPNFLIGLPLAIPILFFDAIMIVVVIILGIGLLINFFSYIYSVKTERPMHDLNDVFNDKNRRRQYKRVNENEYKQQERKTYYTDKDGNEIEVKEDEY